MLGRIAVVSALLLCVPDAPARGQSLSCDLTAGGNWQPNEGPTDYNLHLSPQGTPSAVMVFVDFPDAPQNESTASLYDLLVPNSQQWYAEVSYGQVSLNVTPVHTWFRMPAGSSTYGFGDGLTFEEHRAYIADAMAVSDAAVDYSVFDIVYVVASSGAAIAYSPAFHAYPGDGIVADGHEIRHSATFGGDIRNSRPNYGSYVLIHETGHLFGLPDLYEWGQPLYEALRFAGGWDTMSFVTPGAHFLAWHKRKLGWLAPTQVRCLTGNGPIEETLTPASAAGGLKAVVVPTSPATAYVIEVRDQTGEDGRLCSSGVLIYTVSAAIANGSGPITVKPAHNGTDPELIDQCGPLYDAPFGIGPGQVSSFSDATVPLTVEVLASATDNGYVVRVVRQAAGSATLTVTKSGSGKVTSSPAGINCGTDCSQTFAINEAVSLSAIPAAGWKLSAWSGNADCGDGNVIMDADKTCTATFSPLPDLVVSALVAPAGAAPGASITITDTTKNLGLGGAVATTTAYYLSINNKYEAGDPPLGSRSVPALAPGAIQKESAGVVIPADTTAGPYYLLARADAGAAEVEKSETNNVRAKAIAIGPDLTIATISGPTGAPAGSSVTFTVTTKNQIAPAGASTTSLYLSLNNKFDGSDQPLGSRTVTPLNAGAQLKLNFTVTIPGGTPPANYFILARADASTQVTEGNEANNVKSKAFTVTP